MKKRYRELLIVAAYIAMVSVLLLAILIPNVLDALEKARQKRAVADIRAVGTAWFSWLTDQVGDQPVDTTSKSSSDPDSGGSAADLSTLYDSAARFYIPKVPDKDPWGNPYEVTYDGSPLAEWVIQIRCFGRDGEEGGTGYDEDIVWADGFFVRYPAGAQVD
ncbi:MAG: type II secretion system protein GspG [Thermoanaerobaculia bacterium]